MLYSYHSKTGLASECSIPSQLCHPMKDIVLLYKNKAIKHQTIVGWVNLISASYPPSGLTHKALYTPQTNGPKGKIGYQTFFSNIKFFVTYRLIAMHSKTLVETKEGHRATIM